MSNIYFQFKTYILKIVSILILMVFFFLKKKTNVQPNCFIEIRKLLKYCIIYMILAEEQWPFRLLCKNLTLLMCIKRRHTISFVRCLIIISSWVHITMMWPVREDVITVDTLNLSNIDMVGISTFDLMEKPVSVSSDWSLLHE